MERTHSEDSLARRTSPREKDYAERPQTTINLKCGDVPRSINLHVPVAMLARSFPSCVSRMHNRDLAIIRFEGLSRYADRIYPANPFSPSNGDH